MHAIASSSPRASSRLPPPRNTPARVYPYDRLREISDGFVQIIEAWSCVPEDVIRLSTLATDLVGLVDAAPQVCLGMGARLQIGSISMRHALYAAIVGAQLARIAQLEASRQLAVVKAAMVMNISSFQLQDDLAAPWASPSLGQRITLSRHPQLSAELIASSPGADLRWIEAVEQHHEAMDGSGYPHALTGDEICLEARILKVADLWCALVSPRPQRSGKSPREALHWMLSRHQQCLDPAILDAQRRLSGNYPPGTLVRLANREIALVTNWSRGNAPPRHVVALISAQNTLLRDPSVRDTGKSAYAVRSYSFLPQIEIKPAFWNRVWSMECAAD